ncbi:hypothetical protein [Tamlana sp. I1]|uniref:hypothetical protein n=1 Tax=Tamlana sp. I1 TaxID=2762061 RepID=UPI001890922B|nr:hypothetical protein [Tamlana sp. I1]
MKINLKRVLIVILLIGVVVIAAIPVSNYFIKEKIKTTLNNLPEHIKLEVDDFSVSVLSGTLVFNNINFLINSKTTNEKDLGINLSNLLIENVGYKEFLLNDKIVIDSIILNTPEITYYKREKAETDSEKKGDSLAKTPVIQVGFLAINNGNVKVVDKANDSLLFKAERFSLNLNEVTNKVHDNYKTPISFTSFDFIAEGIECLVGEYEKLNVGDIRVNNQTAKINSLEVKTKYSKKELSKIIRRERDYYDLNIDSLSFDDLDVGFKNDTLFYLNSEKLTIYNPDFEVYRDKLVVDNHSEKPMYSKMLRDLKFNLNVDNLEIINGEIVYEERVNHHIVPGRIFFKEFNANMTKISNTYPEGGQTTITTHSMFMGISPLKTHWEFDVKNKHDRFLFKAELGRFHASKMNEFMEPNLNVRLEGTLKKTYFTIDGNSHASSIDLLVDYDGLTVDILNKHSRGINKALSAVANLFVSKTTEKGNSVFAEGKKHSIQRDRTKSVFNYIWINVKAGLLHAKK